MKLQTKLILCVSSVAALTAILLSVVLNLVSKDIASNIVSEQIEQRMVALRDAKKEQIESYLNLLEGKLLTLANSKMLREASTSFIAAFNNYPVNNPLSSQRSAVASYYQDEFFQVYKEKNEQVRISAEDLVSGLSDTALILQFEYIANNPHSLGEKDNLVKADDGSDYSLVHMHYHDSIRAILNEFGLYDIFIVDIHNGNVVYSVFKEIDYGTSLKTGNFRASGLANVFNKAQTLGKGKTAFVDFSPYKPSYESPASFIATPIFDNGIPVSILIFQMPIDKINSVMTYSGEWSKRGLGTSGETFLVGADKKMRSLSRFFMEDKTNYLAALKQAGISANTLKEIELKNTNIGLQPVTSRTVEKAFEGQSGFEKVLDYRGTSVASAFSYIDIFDTRWAILSEIDEDEAYASISMLDSRLLNATIITTLLVIIFMIVIASIFSKRLVKPIKHLNAVIDQSSRNLDLTLVCVDKQYNTGDEIGQLAQSFDNMTLAFSKTLKQVMTSSKELMDKVEFLTKNFKEITNKTQQQKEYSTQVAAAVEEMAATSVQVAESALGTFNISKSTVELSEEGRNNVIATVSSNEELAELMKKNTDIMTELDRHSSNIGSVLDVISGVAEQTNLLALNAAIEAARAGEQGRGFAVVADEVRSLAQRTEVSTKEIQAIIKGLQSETMKATGSIKNSLEIAQDTLLRAKIASSSLTTTLLKLNEISSNNEHVATAATQQSASANDMSAQVARIDALSRDNFALISKADALVNDVKSESLNLQKAASRFVIDSEAD